VQLRYQIDGIRYAGAIHDIGKLFVPAEILSKPTKLNGAGMILIKSHPQVGYEILKGLEFPWPVAEIVLQHHERMLGDGKTILPNEENALPYLTPQVLQSNHGDH